MTAEQPPEVSRPEDGPPTTTRPGLNTFTIEGRAAPGLFVVGWLATILGLGIVLVGVLAASRLVYFAGFIVLTVGLFAGAGNQAIERRARGAPYAGPSPYLVIVAIFVSIISVGAVVGLLLDVLRIDGLPRYAVILVGVSLQALVAIGVLRLTVVGTDALSWSDMGWRRPDRRSLAELAAGASLAAPVIGVTLILGAVLISLLRVVPTSPLPATGTSIGIVVNLLAGAVIAPIYEETVFRGFAITAWERTSGARSALIKASLLFALAHVVDISASSAGEGVGLVIVGFATRLPVAFALGWVFLRRRTIWAPIGLHLAFNAIQLILSEVARASGSA